MADALKPLLAPLLAPLLLLPGPEPPRGANLAVAVVADPQLACLPLELLPLLRENRVAVACRDLSVGVMAQWMLREPPSCEKSEWGYAVDPRNEVVLRENVRVKRASVRASRGSSGASPSGPAAGRGPPPARCRPPGSRGGVHRPHTRARASAALRARAPSVRHSNALF